MNRLAVSGTVTCVWGAALAASGAILRPELTGAWLLMLLTSALVWRVVVYFDLTPAETVVLLCVFTALFGLSFYNYEAGPLPGAEADARTFYLTASALTWSEWSFRIGTDAYLGVLGAVLSATGGSLLAGQHFSIMIAVFGTASFVAVMRELDIERVLWSAGIAVFGLMPSFLFYSMLTLRESLMLACFVGGAWAAAVSFRRRSTALLLVAWLLWFGMGTLHQIMLFLLVVLVPASGAAFAMSHAGGRFPRRALAATAVVAVVAAGLIRYGPVTIQNDYVDDLRRGFAPAVVEYRNAIDRAHPKTGYGFSVIREPTTEFAKGIARSYYHYLFGPLWRPLRSAADYVLFGEAVFRALGVVVMAAAALWFGAGRHRLTLLGVLYLTVTMIWSVGTTNHGQAFRHHMLSNWILVLGSAIAVSAYFVHRRANDAAAR